jgi:hypothetical protein
MLVLVLLRAAVRLIPPSLPVYSQPPTRCILALGVGHGIKRAAKREGPSAPVLWGNRGLIVG